MAHRNLIESPTDRRKFAVAGNATFTVVSPTGNRFTFRVRTARGKKKADSPLFVAVMSGSDNESSYSYLGTIFDEKTYRHGRKSRYSDESKQARAFAWLWSRLYNEQDLKGAEFWHEGRCGACNRKLTVPASIESGIGPVCAGRA